MYKDALMDKGLSLKAKGLLTTIMSLPADWDFSVAGICKLLKEGKSVVYTCINELIESGYCKRVQNKEEGKFAGVDYVFYEEKQVTGTFEPFSNFSDTENPDTENPHTENRTQLIINSNINNKEIDNLNTEKKEIKQRKNVVFDIQGYLADKGVDEEVIDAWLIVRKNKKAPATELAMKLIDKEVAKAGITWNDAISECVLRNWQGFKASWLHKDEDRKRPQSQYTAEDLALVQSMFEH